MSSLASLAVGAERAPGGSMDHYLLLAERGLEYKIVRTVGHAAAFVAVRDLRARGWVVEVEVERRA